MTTDARWTSGRCTFDSLGLPLWNGHNQPLGPLANEEDQQVIGHEVFNRWFGMEDSILRSYEYLSWLDQDHTEEEEWQILGDELFELLLRDRHRKVRIEEM